MKNITCISILEDLYEEQMSLIDAKDWDGNGRLDDWMSMVWAADASLRSYQSSDAYNILQGVIWTLYVTHKIDRLQLQEALYDIADLMDRRKSIIVTGKNYEQYKAEMEMPKAE